MIALLSTNGWASPPPAEAQRRLAEHGPNELVERVLKSQWCILWEKLTRLMLVILVVAAAVK